jgi:hypothetical protein
MTTKKQSAFDLSSLDTIAACNKGAEIEIRHPVTRAPTGVFISVLGKDSDVYRGIVRGMADESLRKQAIGKNALGDESLDRMEAKNIAALVAATTGWRTGDEQTVTLNGAQLEFSKDNARKVYAEILPIREQVAEAINEMGNFMPA